MKEQAYSLETVAQSLGNSDFANLRSLYIDYRDEDYLFLRGKLFPIHKSGQEGYRIIFNEPRGFCALQTFWTRECIQSMPYIHHHAKRHAGLLATDKGFYTKLPGTHIQFISHYDPTKDELTYFHQGELGFD